MYSTLFAARRRVRLGPASLAVLAMLTAGCQPDEQPQSGNSWDCICQLTAEGAEVDVHACAMTAGEAAAIATSCVAAERGEVRICDCIESSTWFCELGECVFQ